uniref:Uncharacterized protein LOC105647525 n=1 Tax=Rhizophora mucronata TaxID=61149 RepID=A0A2P2J7Y6_RHIMU
MPNYPGLITVKSSNVIDKSLHISPTIISIWSHPVTSNIVTARTYIHTTRPKFTKLV